MQFALDQKSLAFRHGHRPAKGSLSFDINCSTTAAGLFIANVFRTSIDTWAVDLVNMSWKEAEGLEGFFILAGTLEESFSWTWADGTVKTVRFNTPELEITEKAGSFDARLELVKV